jgi:hypothetical protein
MGDYLEIGGVALWSVRGLLLDGINIGLTRLELPPKSE